MSGAKNRTHKQPTGLVGPVDVADGIPDRSARRAWWKYALLAAVFLGWVAFLVYCQLAGAPG